MSAHHLSSPAQCTHPPPIKISPTEQNKKLTVSSLTYNEIGDSSMTLELVNFKKYNIINKKLQPFLKNKLSEGASK